MLRVHSPATKAPAAPAAAVPAPRPWGEAGGAAAAGHDFARVAIRPPAAEPVVQRAYTANDVDDLATEIRNGGGARGMRNGLEHLKRFDPADHAGMLADLQQNHANEHTTYTQGVGAATHAGMTVDQDRGVVFSPYGARVWQPGEIAAAQGVMDRLPRSHLSGVSLIGRADQAAGNEDPGGRANSPARSIAIFDAGVNNANTFRMGGTQSEIGGHAGHPVTALEEVLTHEIGHTVEHNHPAAFAEFQRLAGWSQLTQGQARTSLSADTGVAEANLGPTMGTIGWGAGPRAGRHQYNANGPTYFRRELGMMPGDTDAPGFNVSPDVRTPVGGGPDLSSYSRFSPKEHFAEMYAQMVHAPETVFAQHVEQPMARQRAARQAADAAGQAYENTSIFSPVEKYRRHGERAAAQATLDAREEQARRMSSLWLHMRENVFGVNRQMENTHRDDLRARAAHLGGDQRAQVNRDWAEAAPKAATPWQLEQLKQRIANQHGI